MTLIQGLQVLLLLRVDQRYWMRAEMGKSTIKGKIVMNPLVLLSKL